MARRKRVNTRGKRPAKSPRQPRTAKKERDDKQRLLPKLSAKLDLPEAKPPVQQTTAKEQKTSQKPGDPAQPMTSRQLTSAEKEMAAVEACLTTTAVVCLGDSEIIRPLSVDLYTGIPTAVEPGTRFHTGIRRHENIDDEEGHLIFSHSDVLIGRYVLEYPLGKGTFGQVAEAYDEQADRNVAIKISSNKEDSLTCARDELAILAKLNGYDSSGRYPWVKMLDYMEFWGHRMLVMERLSDDLYSFMKKQKKSFLLQQVREIASQILWCLIGLQNNMVIHTDLNTQNICLVDTDSTASYGFRTERTVNLKSTAIKVIDFGCATLLTDPDRGLIQKRFYRCPEVIFAMKWGYPSDVWSVGCILFEIYTGVLLFPVSSDEEHIGAMEAVLGPLSSMYSDTRYYKSLVLNQPNKGKFKNLSAYMKSKAREHKAFFDLLSKLLEPDPHKRISPRSALRHQFFTSFRQGH